MGRFATSVVDQQLTPLIIGAHGLKANSYEVPYSSVLLLFFLKQKLPLCHTALSCVYFITSVIARLVFCINTNVERNRRL